MPTVEVQTSPAVKAIEHLSKVGNGQVSPDIFVSNTRMFLWEPLRTGPTGATSIVRSQFISNGGIKGDLGTRTELFATGEGAAALSDNKGGVDFVRFDQESRFPGLEGPVLTYGSVATRTSIVFSGETPSIVQAEKTDLGVRYKTQVASGEELAVVSKIVESIQAI